MSGMYEDVYGVLVSTAGTAITAAIHDMGEATTAMRRAAEATGRSDSDVTLALALAEGEQVALTAIDQAGELVSRPETTWDRDTLTRLLDLLDRVLSLSDTMWTINRQWMQAHQAKEA